MKKYFYGNIFRETFSRWTQKNVDITPLSPFIYPLTHLPLFPVQSLLFLCFLLYHFSTQKKIFKKLKNKSKFKIQNFTDTKKKSKLQTKKISLVCVFAEFPFLVFSLWLFHILSTLLNKKIVILKGTQKYRNAKETTKSNTVKSKAVFLTNSHH